MIYTWESVWELCIRVFLEKAGVGSVVVLVFFFSFHFLLCFLPLVYCVSLHFLALH